MRLGLRQEPLSALAPFVGFAMVVALVLSTYSPGNADVLLDGMPRYMWWSGCAPTSGGMVVGYWNSSSYPLYDGDASVWNASVAGYSSNQAGGLPGGVAGMLGSWAHVHEGDLAGYDTSLGRGRYTPLSRDQDCIADFMYANNGFVASPAAVAEGLVDFAAWDNPDTELNESVVATSSVYWTFSAPDPWGVYVSELEEGRPSVLMLRESTSGHAIAGYGYRIISETRYMAVYDTWDDGLTWAPTGSFIEDGVEWWPWLPTWASPTSPDLSLDIAAFEGYDVPYGHSIPYGARGWTVDAIVTFDAEPVPEPATLAMVLLGIGAVAARRRRDPSDEQ